MSAAAAKTIYAALLEAQRAMPDLQKNAINPHFGNRYISLDSLMEQVLPVLNGHGFVLVQAPSHIGSDPALTTRLIYARTGEAIEDTMPLCLGKNDPQGQGSAITYARRYALMAMLGLVADVDDDAQSVKTQPRQQTPTPGPAPGSAPGDGFDSGLDSGSPI